MNDEAVQAFIAILRARVPQARVEDLTLGMAKGYVDVFVGERFFNLEILTGDLVGVTEIEAGLEARGFDPSSDELVQFVSPDQLVEALILIFEGLPPSQRKTWAG